MILCLDCGNTAIDLGFYDETGLLKSRYLFLSRETRGSDDFVMRLKLLASQDNLSCNGAIISSVVPSLTKVLADAIAKVFNVKVKILNKDLKTKLPIKIDNPKELGTDFISTAVGALEKYKAPLVIADLGTTTKLSVIDKNGCFIGGVITAGMKVSLKGLVDNTAQLYDVLLEKPNKIICKNTKECIQSGVIYGQAYMVSEFARRMENELGYSLNRVLTGGFSKIIKDEIVCFAYEENLALDGLFKIYKINESEK